MSIKWFSEVLLSVLGFVDAVGSVLSIIFGFPEQYPDIIVVRAIIYVLLLIFFIQYKRSYYNIFNLQLVLAKNNKLHPLRELVMIAAKNKKHDLINYRFKITQATFSYIIEPSHGENTYDVQYGVNICIYLLLIDKIWIGLKMLLSKHSPVVSLFTICENSIPTLGHVKIMNISQPDVLFHPSTMNGESNDKSEEFAGLYEISFPIPIDIILNHSCFSVDIVYKVPNQIIQNATQYTFVIIPKNFGRKIHEITAQLSGNVRVKPQLHTYSPSKPYFKGNKENATISIQQDAQNNLYKYIFKPKMKNAYVIQVELPNNVNPKT